MCSARCRRPTGASSRSTSRPAMLCARAVAELAAMPGLLARLAPERAAALAEDPDGASAPGPRDDLLDAVRRADRRRRTRRTRYWWGAVAAAAAVAVLAIVLPLTIGPPATARESVAFEAAVDAPLTATATLTQVGWGTRIELDCRYGDGDADVPEGGWPYSLVVIERRRHAKRGLELAGTPRRGGAPVRGLGRRPRRHRLARDPGGRERQGPHARHPGRAAAGARFR